MTDPMDELQQARDAVNAMVRKNVGGREQLAVLISEAMSAMTVAFPFGAQTILTHLAWKAYTLGLEKGMTGEAMRETVTRIKREVFGEEEG